MFARVRVYSATVRLFLFRIVARYVVNVFILFQLSKKIFLYCEWVDKWASIQQQKQCQLMDLLCERKSHSAWFQCICHDEANFFRKWHATGSVQVSLVNKKIALSWLKKRKKLLCQFHFTYPSSITTELNRYRRVELMNSNLTYEFITGKERTLNFLKTDTCVKMKTLASAERTLMYSQLATNVISLFTLCLLQFFLVHFLSQRTKTFSFDFI